MGFQIKNEKGEALTIQNLDKEAAELWGMETDPKWYASPVTITDADDLDQMSKQMSWNWFDKVGWLIDQGASSWDEVKEKFLAPQQELIEKLQPKYPKIDMKEYILGSEEVKRTLALIDYWSNKQYTPIPVKG